MIAQIQNIDSHNFTLNGIPFKKVFIAKPIGVNSIQIVCAYDSKLELLPPTKIEDVQVDSNSYNTISDLINVIKDILLNRNIEVRNTYSLKSYETLSALNSSNGSQENESAKVTNDPTSTNNGFYHFDGTNWVKDAELVEQEVNENNTSIGVSGKAVFDKVHSLKNQVSLVDVNSSEHNITVSGNDITYSWKGGIRLIDRHTGKRCYIVGSDSSVKSITVTKATSGSSVAVLDSDILSTDQNINYEIISIYQTTDSFKHVLLNAFTDKPTGLIADFFLSLGFTPTWKVSDFSQDIILKKRQETQFQIFNQNPTSGNIDIEYDNNGSAIITLTGDLLLHTSYKKPDTTTAYSRLVTTGQTKTITVPKYKSLYLDIEAALQVVTEIPDSAYTMTNNVADVNMVNKLPTDKVLLFSNWSQDFKGASGLFKDYIIGKKVELIKESNTPLVNLHPQVLEKLPIFIEKYAYGIGGTAENPCNILMLGDSLFARETHTNLLDVIPSENPPSLVTKNIGAYLHEYIQGQKPIYSRYDKSGVFTEVGTWTETTADTSWDDNLDRPLHTKKTTSANASIQFATSKPYFNLIDRIDVNGSNSLTVAITGGNGRVLARVENTTNWVEANGFQFSQNKTDNGSIGNGFGNSRYQRRIEFKKVGAGVGTSDTITITKPNNASTFMYWGIEEIEENKPYTRILNMARGGHKLDQLATYIEDDVFARNPTLVILEIPLLNMVASNSTLDYNLNQLQDFVWGDRAGNLNANSLKNRSNNWQDFNVLLVIPHHSKVHFNADSSFKKESSNYTTEEIYKAIKGLIFSKGDLPFIDISTAFLNEIDVDVNFSDRYSAMGSSGKDGIGYFNDSLHQNDKGTRVWAKHLCPLLQLN